MCGITEIIILLKFVYRTQPSSATDDHVKTTFMWILKCQSHEEILRSPLSRLV